MLENELSQTDIQTSYEAAVKSSKRRRNVIIGLVAVIAAIVVALAAAGLVSGVIAPGSVAAKYGTLSYIQEQDVTDYVNIYRTQMGYEDSTDDEWAAFLVGQGTTPSELRTMTIYELVADELIRSKCKKLGIELDASEVDSVVASVKEYLALGDDEEWAEQLASYGTTEEAVWEVYELQLLRNALCAAEVEIPEASDDEVKSYMFEASASYENTSTKHTYCFKLSGLDEEGDRTLLDQVMAIRESLIDDGLSEENFATYVATYCDVDELSETGGANGWDLDTSAYSENYQLQLDNLGEGDISGVFIDEDGYAFIWCDQEFELLFDEDEINALDLESDIPSSLYEYYTDCAEYALWETASTEYINNLIVDANIIIYPMPTYLDYYVDLEEYAERVAAEDADE